MINNEGAGAVTTDVAVLSPSTTMTERFRTGVARLAVLVMVGVTAMFAVQLPAGASNVEVAPGGAVAAAEALVAGESGNAFVSRDVVRDIGHRPGIEEDRATNMTGDCSSPVPLPGSFDAACRTHDLGYDLLRAADDRGEQIPATLRPGLDREMRDQMLKSCPEAREISDGGEGFSVERLRCETAAHIAWAGVAVNTIRQGNGAPVEEPWLPW